VGRDTSTAHQSVVVRETAFAQSVQQCKHTPAVGNCPSLLVQPSNRRGIGIETPMPPCAFKMSMLNVSAIRIKSRSWLRFSSTHEPSDPPLGIICVRKSCFMVMCVVDGGTERCSLSLRLPPTHCARTAAPPDSQTREDRRNNTVDLATPSISTVIE
jgi:hypothetical protein